jgi:hypothetical protein
VINLSIDAHQMQKKMKTYKVIQCKQVGETRVLDELQKERFELIQKEIVERRKQRAR